MTAVLLAAVYIVVHLLLFFTWLRHVPAFSRERVIFAYHACSVLLLVFATVVVWYVKGETLSLASFIAIVCLHGIYSLSFLELWALADGGFSLSLLRAVQAANGAPLQLGSLHELGASKRAARRQDLVALGLARRTPGGLELTPIGRVVAIVMHEIVRGTNLRHVG